MQAKSRIKIKQMAGGSRIARGYPQSWRSSDYVDDAGMKGLEKGLQFAYRNTRTENTYSMKGKHNDT